MVLPTLEAPVQAVPAVALVRAGGSGNADVPVDVVPLNAGLAEPELLAEGVHASYTLLQVRLVRTQPKRVMRPCYVLSTLAATGKWDSPGVRNKRGVPPLRPAGDGKIAKLPCAACVCRVFLFMPGAL